MKIETATGALWVEQHGSGIPVVFISGMSQDHRAWVEQEPLSDQFRLILPDNRGTGQSSDWHVGEYDDPPTTGEMADDIVAVLDGLGIDKAHIVGFSMGGRVAQWVAILRPKRVASLVLISTSAGDRHGIARDSEADRLLEGTPMEQSLLMYSSAWMTSHAESLRTIYAATSTRSSQRHLHYLATHGHDSFSSLSRISAPTLIIHGTLDRINPVGNAELLAKQIPQAEVLLIPQGRHAVMAEYADVVNARLREFFSSAC